MTYTVQPLTRTAAKNEEKTKKTEAEKISRMQVSRELLSICDSLNKLCETLGRLDYLLKRTITENNLNPERHG